MAQIPSTPRPTTTTPTERRKTPPSTPAPSQTTPPGVTPSAPKKKLGEGPLPEAHKAAVEGAKELTKAIDLVDAQPTQERKFGGRAYKPGEAIAKSAVADAKESGERVKVGTKPIGTRAGASGPVQNAASGAGARGATRSGDDLIRELTPSLSQSPVGREALRTYHDMNVRIKVDDAGNFNGTYRPVTNTITVSPKQIPAKGEDKRLLAALLVHELTHAKDTHRDGGLLAPVTNVVPGGVSDIVRSVAGTFGMFGRGIVGGVKSSVSGDSAASGFNKAQRYSEDNAYLAQDRYLRDVGIDGLDPRVLDQRGNRHTEASDVVDEVVQGDNYDPGIREQIFGGLIDAAVVANPITGPIAVVNKARNLIGGLLD